MLDPQTNEESTPQQPVEMIIDLDRRDVLELLREVQQVSVIRRLERAAKK